MRTLLQVLSEDERAQVHERSLNILAKTGVRVDTDQGRQVLKAAGAHVDENTSVVRFPRTLVEESLKTAPKRFTLGARRPGWKLQMNGGDCVLLVDGEAMFVIDRETGERRPSTYEDWLEATRLIDAIDAIGVYWQMLEGGTGENTRADLVTYWRAMFRNFSKHIQDSVSNRDEALWLLEILQVVFGDQASIRRQHPLSFLLCPQSPLIIEGPYTDAYLALSGWDIPVAIMPMPLMGATAPGSLIATIVQGNCEVLAMLCLLQAAAPGTPIIYAPALAVVDPRSGRYGGGPIEHALLGAATTEMGRYYGLPVIASGIGSDHDLPGIQSSTERAMNGLLPALSWPDILVGPGLLGGSMTLSFEQLWLDVETFDKFKRARRGIVTTHEKWLEDVVGDVGPGGHFLAELSTVQNVRSGEWHISQLGVHDTFEGWEAAGKPDMMDDIRAKVEQTLNTHQPLPLDEDVERELDRIQEKAQAAIA